MQAPFERRATVIAALSNCIDDETEIGDSQLDSLLSLTERNAFTLLYNSNSRPSMPSAQLPPPVQPSTRLGNWCVHLARFGHQQIVIATSERSLLTVLLPARQLRESIEFRFQAAVAELLDALHLRTKIVNRELAAVQPISFGAASNRRVIGSMTEFVRQIESDLPRIGDPLHLSLRLGETPMSAVGSKGLRRFAH